MEGLPCDGAGRLRVTHESESSRLQFELLRRAFELLVPGTVTPPCVVFPRFPAGRPMKTANTVRQTSRKER
jgi:hypothetical protein